MTAGASAREVDVPDDGYGPDPGAEPTRRSIAREYRHRRARREPFRATVYLGVLVALGALVVYFAENVGPGPIGPALTGNNSTSAGGTGGPTKTITVTFGTTAQRTVTCGDGQTFPAEFVPWQGSSQGLSTSQVFFELVELIDGDIDGGPGPVPSVTGSLVCAGAPPHTYDAWYVVLQNPVGANIAYFTYSAGWVMLEPHQLSVPIQNDSTLVFLSDPNVSGLSFGLCVLGDVGPASLDDCASL